MGSISKYNLIFPEAGWWYNWTIDVSKEEMSRYKWTICISKEKMFQVLNFKVFEVFLKKIAEKCKFCNLTAFSKFHSSHFIVIYALPFLKLKHITNLYKKIYNSCIILDFKIVKKYAKWALFFLIPYHFKYNYPP